MRQSEVSATQTQTPQDNPLKTSQHSPRTSPDDVGKALNVNENDVRNQKETDSGGADQSRSKDARNKQ